jgi:hypothetical protein
LQCDGTFGEAASRIDDENFTNLCAVLLRRRGKGLRCCGSAAASARLRAVAMVKFSSMVVCGCCNAGADRSVAAVPDAIRCNASAAIPRSLRRYLRGLVAWCQ